MLKKIVFSVSICLLFIGTTFAQFGFNVGYNVNNAADWKITGTNDQEIIADFHTNSMAFGLDYWFRLKNYRIEFTPEINFSSATAKNTLDEIDIETTLRTYSFFFNTNFYIFEFKGDCNCPTFSKPGLELEKGVFIRLSPGVALANGQFKTSSKTFINNSLAFSIAAGIGLDLGISDFITLTPIIMYRYYPDVKWEYLSPLSTSQAASTEWTYPKESSAISQIYGGIRLGIRFDYRK